MEVFEARLNGRTWYIVEVLCLVENTEYLLPCWLLVYNIGLLNRSSLSYYISTVEVPWDEAIT